MGWKCEIPKTFPFYLIKENLCMIKINNKDELQFQVAKENLLYEEINAIPFVSSEDYFSVYIPSGPKVFKSIQSA